MIGDTFWKHHPNHDDDGGLDDVVDYMAGHGWNGPRSKVYGPPLACRRCGDRNVYWQRERGEYKLFNTETVQPHECKNSPDGFEDVA